MKMLINFTTIDGRKMRLKPEVIEVVQPYPSRPDIYQSASGDIFRCSKGRKYMRLLRRHKCDVVAVA